VVDQPPHRSRIIQGLPAEKEGLNPLSPPLRHQIYQSNTFVSIGLFETIDMKPVETNASTPKIVTILDLEVKDFTHPFNPSLTGHDTPVVVQILALESNFTDSRPLRWVVMEGTPEVSSWGSMQPPHRQSSPEESFL
jgi:hypothetical protein